MRYFVVDIVDSNSAEAAREAIGRVYAEQRGEVWPIRAVRRNGQPDLNIFRGTFYYWDPQVNLLGTQVAFGPVSDAAETALAALCAGRQVTTTLGQVTLPAATTELLDAWFAPQRTRQALIDALEGAGRRV